MLSGKPKKKVKNLVDKINDFVAWFLGSWWAVIFHTIWFIVWIVFYFNVNILTLGVSLEAIFIGIFLLMAANKAEIKRDLREMVLRKEEQERMEFDIKLDQKEDRHLGELKRNLREIKERIETIEKFLKK